MKRTDVVKSLNVKPYISKRKKKEEENKNTQQTNTPEVHFNDAYNTAALDQKEDESNFIYTILPKEQVVNRKEHTNVAGTVKWSPNSQTLFASAGFDKTLIIWDFAYKKLCVKRKISYHKEAIKDVLWSRNGKSLLSASFDKTSKLFDVETGVCMRTYNHADLVTSVGYHPVDDNVILTGTMKSGIFAWDARQEKVVKEYKSFFGQVHDMLFLPDNKTFISCAEVVRKNCMDKAMIAWDFETTAVLPYQIYQEPHTCTRLKLYQNKNKKFYAQSSAGYVAIFDAYAPFKMSKYKRYEGHKCTGYRVGFDVSSDGRYLYTGDTDGLLFIYNVSTSKIIKQIRVFDSPCVDISCNMLHESRVVCSSWDGRIAVLE